MTTLSHATGTTGLHLVNVHGADGDIIYTTEEFEVRAFAEQAATRWCKWADGVPQGRGDSIYYILAVPIGWPGPIPGAHRYSGLHFKIGRATNVLKRLQNLRTGTSEDLIIHALEPGNQSIEAERHQQFSSDRRQGEWFAASPRLCRHVHETWRKNRLLPPDHQLKILAFFDRSQIYARLRSGGFNFDMINPSLNEPWFGSVFLDLIHTSLVRATETQSPNFESSDDRCQTEPRQCGAPRQKGELA